MSGAPRSSSGALFEGEAEVCGRQRLIRLVRGTRGPAILQWHTRESASAFEWQPEAVHEILPGATTVLGGVKDGVRVQVIDLLPRDPSVAVAPPLEARSYIFRPNPSRAIRSNSAARTHQDGAPNPSSLPSAASKPQNGATSRQVPLDLKSSAAVDLRSSQTDSAEASKGVPPPVVSPSSSSSGSVPCETIPALISPTGSPSYGPMSSAGGGARAGTGLAPGHVLDATGVSAGGEYAGQQEPLVGAAPTAPGAGLAHAPAGSTISKLAPASADAQAPGVPADPPTGPSTPPPRGFPAADRGVRGSNGERGSSCEGGEPAPVGQDEELSSCARKSDESQHVRGAAVGPASEYGSGGPSPSGSKGGTSKTLLTVWSSSGDGSGAGTYRGAQDFEDDEEGDGEEDPSDQESSCEGSFKSAAEEAAVGGRLASDNDRAAGDANSVCSAEKGVRAEVAGAGQEADRYQKRDGGPSSASAAADHSIKDKNKNNVQLSGGRPEAEPEKVGGEVAAELERNQDEAGIELEEEKRLRKDSREDLGSSTRPRANSDSSQRSGASSVSSGSSGASSTSSSSRKWLAGEQLQNSKEAEDFVRALLDVGAVMGWTSSSKSKKKHRSKGRHEGNQRHPSDRHHNEHQREVVLKHQGFSGDRTPSAIAFANGRHLSRALTMTEELWKPLQDRRPLEEQFELRDLLGEGGFANVYTAIHRRSGTEVAVKIMLLKAGETVSDQRSSLTASAAKRSSSFVKRLSNRVSKRSSFESMSVGEEGGSSRSRYTSYVYGGSMRRVPTDETIDEDDLASPPMSPAKHRMNTKSVSQRTPQRSDDDKDEDAHNNEELEKVMTDHERRVQNFEWEIRVMRKIREELPVHPNLVHLYAVCTAAEPPRTCLVMEKLDGGELFERIVARSHYTEQDAAHLFRTLIRAIHDLHHIGIVHRDLKPENVIFTDQSFYSTVKIADYGTAFLMDYPDQDPYKDKRIGSPGYSAPEVNKMKYTPACDVWSMGVLLYCLLCGYLPFPEGFMQIIKVMTGQFDFPEDSWGHISDDAKDLITQMLTVSMTKRITTAEILQHPWLTHLDIVHNTTHEAPDLGEAQQRMKTFNLRRKFKSAAMAAVWSARMRINRVMKSEALEHIKSRKTKSKGRRRGTSQTSESSVPSL